MPLALPIKDISIEDTAWAGGKGANLGELARAGFPVADGFVVGVDAYLQATKDVREKILGVLRPVERENEKQLESAAATCQELVRGAPFPKALSEEIKDLYPGGAVAVRSSASAEDSPGASFAGMNETFLGIVGEKKLEEAIRNCWASLFAPRSIYYRLVKEISEEDIAIAAIVQKQIASERSGIMFTADPISGSDKVLVIESSYGLGNLIVSGEVSPDRFIVDKKSLQILESYVVHKKSYSKAAKAGGVETKEVEEERAGASSLHPAEIRELAASGKAIEEHYERAQDIEWAIDEEGRPWIMQTRPITTQALREEGELPSEPAILEGVGVAPGTSGGPARIVPSMEQAEAFREGEVLVAGMTAPDWVPLMRKAAAVVTDAGGITCHAAIVSRELGVPCIVGTGEATSILHNGQEITVDSRYGRVYEGIHLLPQMKALQTGDLPDTKTKILVNLSEPSQIKHAAGLAVDGVGLLRAELMILEALDGDHPRLFIEQGRESVLVDRLYAALQKFSDAFRRRPITYRTIDFRSNEFRSLRGGSKFEPEEANPMIGYRGALRYSKEPDLFRLELEAVKRVWDSGGKNLHLMLPFVRRAKELKACKELIGESGLLAHKNFELWIMAEVPSVLFELEAYAREGIAGISIGSNDLTQLMLGADRDSELLEDTFDERDPAVMEYISELIWKAKRLELGTSICGQAPSVYPEYTDFLVRSGIDAISVAVDSVEAERHLVAAAEEKFREKAPRRLQAPSLQS